MVGVGVVGGAQAADRRVGTGGAVGRRSDTLGKNLTEELSSILVRDTTVCQAADARITPQQIADLCQQISDSFRPEKIILFGSYAYGTPHQWSDVDLLVVMEFEGQAVNWALEIFRVIQPMFAVDLIVQNSAEVARRYREFDPLIRTVVQRGKVLYCREVGEQGSDEFGHLLESHLSPSPMASELNQTVLEWVRKADEDWRVAQVLRQADQGMNDAIAFHAQQAAEKLMKALLIQHQVEVPFTHDLGVLHDLLAQWVPGWQADRAGLVRLTVAAVRFRYPDESATAAIAEDCLAVSEGLRAQVLAVLGYD